MVGQEVETNDEAGPFTDGAEHVNFPAMLFNQGFEYSETQSQRPPCWRERTFQGENSFGQTACLGVEINAESWPCKTGRNWPIFNPYPGRLDSSVGRAED
jgi:hypothetical protein